MFTKPISRTCLWVPGAGSAVPLDLLMLGAGPLDLGGAGSCRVLPGAVMRIHLGPVVGAPVPSCPVPCHAPGAVDRCRLNPAGGGLGLLASGARRGSASSRAAKAT